METLAAMDNLADRFAGSGPKGPSPEPAPSPFPSAREGLDLDYRPLARSVVLDCIAQYRSTLRQSEESEVEYARVAEPLHETSGEAQSPAEADLARRWEAWSNLAYRRLTDAEQQLIRAIQVWFGYSTSAWDVEREGYLWRTAGVAFEGRLYIATANRHQSAASLAVVELACLADIPSGGPSLP